MGWWSGKRCISAWSNVCLVVAKESMCVGAWTELLGSEAGRGAKRTEGTIVLTCWSLARECMRDLRVWVENEFTSFSRSNVRQCITKAWTKRKTCPHARAHHPRVVKNVPKTRFSVFGRFLGGFLCSQSTLIFFLRQQEEYVSRHTPTPKNRSSLEKRIPHEEKGYVLSCRRTPFIRH